VDAEQRSAEFGKPKVVDSVMLGQQDRWGAHNYIPPSKLETRPEHRKSQVTGYKAYVEFMDKIEKEEAEKGEKAINEYFAKFDKRYRENVALGLQNEDALPYMSEYEGDKPLIGAKRSNDDQREFLAMYNPEVAMDMVTPTAK